jgi:hypothetical protein
MGFPMICSLQKLPFLEISDRVASVRGVQDAAGRIVAAAKATGRLDEGFFGPNRKIQSMDNPMIIYG